MKERDRGPLQKRNVWRGRGGGETRCKKWLQRHGKGGRKRNRE